MIIELTWLLKLFLSHLITDFILQPKSWVNERADKHFASGKLYLHGFITSLLAWIMIGWNYWIVALTKTQNCIFSSRSAFPFTGNYWLLVFYIY